MPGACCATVAGDFPLNNFSRTIILLACLIASLGILGGCSRSKYRSAPPFVQPLPPPMPRNENIAIEKLRAQRRQILITIDAGHGGEDFGAHSSTMPIYHEKNLNLSVAKMLQHFLKEQGYSTMMTRMTDDFISLDRRAEFANNQNSTLFVSMHFNSAPSKEADGIEVFYYRSQQDPRRTELSKELAQSVLDQVIDQTGAKSRGVKHGNLAVIRQTTMPAVLVEGGFLTNDEETQRIKDPSYLKKLAWGVSLGIQDYLAAQN
jgi:N-acetylmuramoyl-L-alanine amidase